MECHRLLGVKSSLLLIFKQDGQQPGSAAQEASSAFTLPKRPETLQAEHRANALELSAHA